MASSITPIDGVLWRIAELGSRFSDPSWPGDRRRVWAELESAIAEARTEISAVVAAPDAAQVRVAEAEARARTAQRERDRQRARASALQAVVEGARSAAEADQARADEAEAARDDALAALRRAQREGAKARAAQAQAEAERDEARAAQVRAEAERYNSRAAQARAEAERDEAQAASAAPPAAAEEAQEEAEQEQEQELALGPLEEAPVQVPVVDLRESADPKAEADDDGVGLASALPGTQEVEEPLPLPGPLVSPAVAVAEPDGTEPVVGLVVGARCLYVGATLGHLLPQDLAPLLVLGASVVRREGRLAALIAVPPRGGVSEWAPSGCAEGEEQARRLRAEGFRVEWASQACLAS